MLQIILVIAGCRQSGNLSSVYLTSYYIDTHSNSNSRSTSSIPQSAISLCFHSTGSQHCSNKNTKKLNDGEKTRCCSLPLFFNRMPPYIPHTRAHTQRHRRGDGPARCRIRWGRIERELDQRERGDYTPHTHTLAQRGPLCI